MHYFDQSNNLPMTHWIYSCTLANSLAIAQMLDLVFLDLEFYRTHLQVATDIIVVRRISYIRCSSTTVLVQYICTLANSPSKIVFWFIEETVLYGRGFKCSKCERHCWKVTSAEVYQLWRLCKERNPTEIGVIKTLQKTSVEQWWLQTEVNINSWSGCSSSEWRLTVIWVMIWKPFDLETFWMKETNVRYLLFHCGTSSYFLVILCL